MNPRSWQTATDPLELLRMLGRGLGRRKAIAVASALHIPGSFLHELTQLNEAEDVSACFCRVLAMYNDHEFKDDAYTWVSPPEKTAELIARTLEWQSDVIREVVAPMHVPPGFLAEWRTPAVRKIAQSIHGFTPETGEDYEAWFALMPALGDALEAAGCRTPEVLDHCRRGTRHVRECWLLDLILEPDRSPNVSTDPSS